MLLTKWRPIEVQRKFKSEFDRLFEDFFDNNGFKTSTDLFQVSPRADIEETDNEYIATLELPGLDKKDIHLNLENNNLVIKGEKKTFKDVKEANLICSERSYGNFLRSFELPTTVKSDDINAEYKDGILKVTLPKAEEAKPKEIQIKVK